MATAELVSPNIFERMFGLAHGCPYPPPDDRNTNENSRFYLCKKEEGKVSYTCQRGTVEQVAAEHVQLAKTEGYNNKRQIVILRKWAPEFADQWRLVNHLVAPVHMGAPLPTAENPAAK